MYASSEQQMILPDDFFLPFGGKLNKNNRWVKLAQMIPWWKVEQHYEKQFKSLARGQKAYSVRLALGALIAVAKRRRVKPHTMRKAIGQQLRYVRRDLRIIETLKDEIGLQVLSRKKYRELFVIQELYRQQEEMYRKRTKRMDGRIVSISQPHVRPDRTGQGTGKCRIWRQGSHQHG